MGHLAQSNPIIKTDLRIKQKWIFNRKAHQLHPLSPHFARPCPPGLAPFLACLLGKDEEPRQTPLPESVSVPREHILEKKKKAWLWDFFAFKRNTLIFAFQAEGRIQPFFPALLLREWGTNPDASSRVRKGTELPQEVRSVFAALSRFLPPVGDPVAPEGTRPIFLHTPRPPYEGGDRSRLGFGVCFANL